MNTMIVLNDIATGLQAEELLVAAGRAAVLTVELGGGSDPALAGFGVRVAAAARELDPAAPLSGGQLSRALPSIAALYNAVRLYAAARAEAGRSGPDLVAALWNTSSLSFLGNTITIDSNGDAVSGEGAWLGVGRTGVIWPVKVREVRLYQGGRLCRVWSGGPAPPRLLAPLEWPGGGPPRDSPPCGWQECAPGPGTALHCIALSADLPGLLPGLLATTLGLLLLLAALATAIWRHYRVLNSQYLHTAPMFITFALRWLCSTRPLPHQSCGRLDCKFIIANTNPLIRFEL